MGLGYACINQTLAEQKITVNRSMIRRTFDEKGLHYVSELIIKNLTDLLTILKWNYSHQIFFYRMSSDMFPWMSEYEITELPRFSTMKSLLIKAGEVSRQYKIRLSYHPGPFNVLASDHPGVVAKTIKELDQHAQIMDLMLLGATPYNKINIHIGTTLGGNKVRAMQQFCNNFKYLKETTKNRLTIENDDKPGMYNVTDLYGGVYENIGIPIVFDYHHHLCNPGEINEKEAFLLAIGTWEQTGIKPVVHYSEPRSTTEKKLFRAHSDYLQKKINTYGFEVDIMLEAKEKEKALLNYRYQQG